MLSVAMATAAQQAAFSGRRGSRGSSRHAWPCLVLVLSVLLATPASAASPSPQGPDAARTSVPLVDLPSPDAAPLSGTVTMPAGARIAYVVGAGGDQPRIHVAAADGSGDSALAAGNAPSWSPLTFAGGEVLAFECVPRTEEGPPSSICLDELESWWDTTLLEVASRPRWSPTGDAIAFTRAGDAAWVADLSGFHPRTSEEIVGPITRLPGEDPEWSPTGDRLLIVDGSEVPTVSTVRPEGTELRTVGEGELATWSPEGRRVAIASWDGTRTTITATSVLTGAADVLAAIASPIVAMRWLPRDGLAVVADRSGSGTGDLYVIELADGSVRSLTAGLAVHPDLSHSPDGAWLAFSAEDGAGQDVYVASRDGGWRPVTTSGDASMPAWGTFRPSFERGAFIQSAVDRLRMRSRPWVGEDSARYEPLLSQEYVLEVLEGPVAGSGYWWYRVRLADWELLQLRDGGRERVRSGWIAVADHDGSAWVGRVDVDPGPRRTPLRRGWPVVRRGQVRLGASPPSIGAEGTLAIEATVSGLQPGTALTLVAEGESQVIWQCGPAVGASDAAMRTVSAGSALGRADVSVGADGTGTTVLQLLPSPAAADLCARGSTGAIPVAADVRWENLRVRDPLHRLVLLPEPVSGAPDHPSDPQGATRSGAPAARG